MTAQIWKWELVGNHSYIIQVEAWLVCLLLTVQLCCIQKHIAFTVGYSQNMQTLIIHLLGRVAEMNKIWFALTQLLDSFGGWLRLV